MKKAITHTDRHSKCSQQIMGNMWMHDFVFDKSFQDQNDTQTKLGLRFLSLLFISRLFIIIVTVDNVQWGYYLDEWNLIANESIVTSVSSSEKMDKSSAFWDTCNSIHLWKEQTFWIKYHFRCLFLPSNWILCFTSLVLPFY